MGGVAATSATAFRAISPRSAFRQIKATLAPYFASPIAVAPYCRAISVTSAGPPSIGISHGQAKRGPATARERSVRSPCRTRNAHEQLTRSGTGRQDHALSFNTPIPRRCSKLRPCESRLERRPTTGRSIRPGRPTLLVGVLHPGSRIGAEKGKGLKVSGCASSSHQPDESGQLQTAPKSASGRVRVCIETNAEIALRKSTVRFGSAPPIR